MASRLPEIIGGFQISETVGFQKSRRVPALDREKSKGLDQKSGGKNKQGPSYRKGGASFRERVIHRGLNKIRGAGRLQVLCGAFVAIPDRFCILLRPDTKFHQNRDLIGKVRHRGLSLKHHGLGG